MEVSRTKLRALGFDWALFDGTDFAYQKVSGLITNDPDEAIGQKLLSMNKESVAVGVIDANNAFFAMLEALRQNNLAKVLAEPTLVAISGRPANFLSGGEFAVELDGGITGKSIEWKRWGTIIDFVPIVLGNGNIRLEVRPEVSELYFPQGIDKVPGVKTRYADTAAELRRANTGHCRVAADQDRFGQQGITLAIRLALGGGGLPPSRGADERDRIDHSCAPRAGGRSGSMRSASTRTGRKHGVAQ